MKGGFVLIEVLVASLISALLGVVLFAAYYQSNRVTQTIDDFIDVYSKEALLQHQLSRDIFGAFIPEHAYAKDTNIEDVFTGSNKDGMLAMLTFITSNPLITYDSNKPRIVRVVYRLQENKQGAGEKVSYTLLRQESTNLDLKVFKKESEKIRTYKVADGIKELKVEYSSFISKNDNIELEKKDVWRAEKEEKKSDVAPSDAQAGADAGKKEIVLPQLVKIFITLWDLQQERERSFTVAIPIFIGGIDREEVEKKPQKEKKTQKNENKGQETKQEKKASPVSKKQTNKTVNATKTHIFGKQSGDKIIMQKETVLVEGDNPPVVIERKTMQVPA